MSKREVSEKEIDNRLEEIINTSDDKGYKNINHVIRLIALILFNVRKELNELYLACEDLIEENNEEDSDPEVKKIKDDVSIFI